MQQVLVLGELELMFPRSCELGHLQVVYRCVRNCKDSGDMR